MDDNKADRMVWSDGDLRPLAPEQADAVRSGATEGETMVDEAHEAAFAARGVTASAAVVAREGLPDGLKYPDRAVGRLLGEEGLGRAFDALVASGTVDHLGLLATAVERSHEYYGVPSVLASGEARDWVAGLSDEKAWSMTYYDAPREFESDQAAAVTASAVARLREKVHGG